MSYSVNENGFYGEFGGAYIPEILYKTVENLRLAYEDIIESEDFLQEYHQLLRDYVGRPSPLYLAERMSEKYGCKLYLKREDLNHTGAHKINNAIGQILLARRMGKTRIIAETGAGQHGVATATVCALMNMPCRVYMGALDVERQHVNVERMRMLGAEVYPVQSGNKTLKDATNEAIRDWCCHPEDTFYIIGSTVGPHPYPELVARLQSVISSEMSATSSLELLKAHAVISRSWLLAQMQHRREVAESGNNFFSFVKKEDMLIRWYDREDHTLFDVCADDHCQRYQGITKETSPHVAEAVRLTRGQVLLEKVLDLLDSHLSLRQVEQGLISRRFNQIAHIRIALCLFFSITGQR